MNIRTPLAALAVAALLGACNSEDAQVTSLAPTGPQNGSSVSPTTATRNSTQGATLGDGPELVSFSNVTSDLQGTLTGVEGLGFLNAGAASARPFSFGFDGDGLAFDARVFAPTSQGELYVWPSGAGQYTLSRFAPLDRQVRDLATISAARISSLSATADSRFIAWIDENAGAWLMQDLAAPTPLKLGSLAAASLGLSERARLLVASGAADAKPRVLVYSFDDLTTPTLAFDATAGVLSPSGATLALLQADADETRLVLVKTADKSTEAVNIEAGLRLSAVSWRNERELAYLATSSSGQATLHDLNLVTGADAVIATLHLPQALAARPGVVCPSWSSSGTLYFSDARGTALSIYAATSDGGAWSVLPFAQPQGELSSLICPQVSVMKEE